MNTFVLRTQCPLSVACRLCGIIHVMCFNLNNTAQSRSGATLGKLSDDCGTKIDFDASMRLQEWGRTLSNPTRWQNTRRRSQALDLGLVIF